MLKRANYQLYSALMTLDAIRGNQDNYMEERATQLRGNTSASLLPLRHQSLTRKFIFKGKKLIDSWIILIFFYQFQFKQNFNRSVPSLCVCSRSQKLWERFIIYLIYFYYCVSTKTASFYFASAFQQIKHFILFWGFCLFYLCLS